MYESGIQCNWTKARSLLVILGIFAFCILTLIGVYAIDWKSEHLMWEDDFDFFNSYEWKHVVTGNRGGNYEFQYFRSSGLNSYSKNGSLHLKATLASDELSEAEIQTGRQSYSDCNVPPCVINGNVFGNCILPVYSAQIRTAKHFNMKRGRVEVRARLPRGDWLRAEIVLIPSESDYRGWPISGLIRIVDACGNIQATLDGHTVCGDIVRQNLNLAFGLRNQTSEWEARLDEGYYSDDFHLFEVEWSGSHIAFRVDGRQTGRIVPPKGGFWELSGFSDYYHQSLNPWKDGTVMAPFDRSFYLLLRLSVGGLYFNDKANNTGYPTPWRLGSNRPITDFYQSQHWYVPTWERPELEVDYIRIYEH